MAAPVTHTFVFRMSNAHTAPVHIPPPAIWMGAACAAVALPMLLAFNKPPSATFLNQVAAYVGWGAWMLWLASPSVTSGWPWRGGLGGLLAALALMALMTLVSPWCSGLPWSLALSSLGTLAATALVVVTAAALARHGQATQAFHALSVALLVAGVVSAALGGIQLFAPEWVAEVNQWANATLIAATSVPGRAVGNLRQPNHLSSLLLWSLVALVWMAERRQLGAPVAVGLGTVLLTGIVLSASRTGMLGVLLLALWGGVDKGLSRRARVLLIGSPLVFALIWAGFETWSDNGQHFFGGDAQLTKGDISSSRFAIWSNTLALIAQRPWLGVGWGEFNFAWTLTPFPDRPVAFFDHTHNLPLQLAVEVGLPMAAALLALLIWALWRAYTAGRDAHDSTARLTLRCAFVMVLLMALHSQLEYPLWYAHFLLPTAFAFGLCLGGSLPGLAAPSLAQQRATRPLWLAAALLLTGASAALYDYMRVVAIFVPPKQSAPLDRRIAYGQRSWLFAHHADYAAVTAVENPAPAAASFNRATHYLLDTRLMTAWARALYQAGDHQRALYLAQRLKEFHNDEASQLFRVCEQPLAPGVTTPFQCLQPTVELSYRDFRHPAWK